MFLRVSHKDGELIIEQSCKFIAYWFLILHLKSRKNAECRHINIWIWSHVWTILDRAYMHSPHDTSCTDPCFALPRKEEKCSKKAKLGQEYLHRILF